MNRIPQPHLGFYPGQTNNSCDQAPRSFLLHPKEMLHSTPDSGTRSIVLDLSICQFPKEVEDISREEGKPLSVVIQDALRLARKERIKKEFYQIQDYWSRKAEEKGILTEKDLERYLKG